MPPNTRSGKRKRYSKPLRKRTRVSEGADPRPINSVAEGPLEGEIEEPQPKPFGDEVIVGLDEIEEPQANKSGDEGLQVVNVDVSQFVEEGDQFVDYQLQEVNVTFDQQTGDAEFEGVDVEVGVYADEEFEGVNEEFEGVNEEFEGVEVGIDALVEFEGVNEEFEGVNVEVGIDADEEGDVEVGTNEEDESVDSDDSDYIEVEEEEDDDFDEKRFSDEDSPSTFPAKFNKEVLYNPCFSLGMVFESKVMFKKAMTSHAVDSKRSIMFPKSDLVRIYAKCREESCDWHCNALKVQDEATFQIRRYNPKHTCAPFNVKNMSSTWLGERSVGDFQSDPKRKLKSWRNDVIRSLNVSVSKQQAYRANVRALKLIEGEPDLQYAKLWDYANELRKTNPGSTIVLDIDGEGKFSQLYVCYAAVKHGFKNGIRPFIGVDGCHLKGPKGGILLAAVGVDPSNQIYPLSVAVVAVENKESWTWFLSLIKTDLDLQQHKGWTFMSDKQKGLQLAFNDVFPDAELRHCVKHLHNNFQLAGFRGLAYKNALWRASRATTIGMFKEAMAKMAVLSEGAIMWFEDKDPKNWSRSHFSTHGKCDMLLNNTCESFNAVILDAREKPIITMLEWLRQWLMERFQKNRDNSKKWKGRLTPGIQQYLRKECEKTNDCLPIKSNNRHYQVECSDGHKFAVDLQSWTCSCRQWELSGIPCKHALSALKHNKCDPELYVDQCYSVETYRKVYEHALIPISDTMEWGETMYIPPKPPSFGRSVGRPKKKRNDYTQKTITKLDKRLPRQSKRGKKCGRCGIQGHTKVTCQTPLCDPGNTTSEAEVVKPRGRPKKAVVGTSVRGRVMRGGGVRGRGRARGSGLSDYFGEDEFQTEMEMSQGPTPWEQVMMSRNQ